MHSAIALAALSGLALVNAQVPGATTIEGSPTYDGLPVPGTTGKLGNAAITQHNPQCVTYNATLPSTGSIQGYVAATANANGTGYVLLGADTSCMVLKSSRKTCFGSERTFLLPRFVLGLHYLSQPSNANSGICVVYSSTSFLLASPASLLARSVGYCHDAYTRVISCLI